MPTMDKPSFLKSSKSLAKYSKIEAMITANYKRGKSGKSKSLKLIK